MIFKLNLKVKGNTRASHSFFRLNHLFQQLFEENLRYRITQDKNGPYSLGAQEGRWKSNKTLHGNASSPCSEKEHRDPKQLRGIQEVLPELCKLASSPLGGEFPNQRFKKERN